MRKLSKIILAFATLAIIFAPASALAANDVLFNNSVCNNATAGSAVCQESGQTSNPLVGSDGLLFKITGIIAIIAGAAAVIVILVSGMSYITSGGDPAKAQKARGALIGALVGLVIIVLSESIIGFVLSKV